jgi:hypothetical protein
LQQGNLIYFTGKLRPGRACQAPGFLLRNLSIALKVPADKLIFDSDERALMKILNFNLMPYLSLKMKKKKLLRLC